MSLKLIKSKKKYTKQVADQMATEYAELSAKIKALTETKNELSAKIKECALELGSKNNEGSSIFDTGSFTIANNVVSRVELDDEKAISFAKKNGFDDCVKIVEAIDEKALEKHYKSGDISDKQMKDLTNISVSYRVSVKKNELMPEIEQVAASRKKVRKYDR